MLGLMNLVGGALRTGEQAVNEQAFTTGEKIGEKLAEDQQKEDHSVETSMEAAKEGMKASIPEAASMLQTGMHNFADVLDDRKVQEEIFFAVDPVRKNPQMDYFSNLANSFADKAREALDQGISQAQL